MQFWSKYNMIILCVHMCMCVCVHMYVDKVYMKEQRKSDFHTSRQTVDGLSIHQVWRHNKETLSHPRRDKQVTDESQLTPEKNPICLWKFNYVLSSRNNRMEFSKKKKWVYDICCLY